MNFKKISHGILMTVLAFATSMPHTISALDNQTLARVILSGAGFIIGASKIYANKEGKTKQQKRDTLLGAAFIAAGAATFAGPEIYAYMIPTKYRGLITKPLPPLPAQAKVKHPWKAWFNTWLDKF